MVNAMEFLEFFTELSVASLAIVLAISLGFRLAKHVHRFRVIAAKQGLTTEGYMVTSALMMCRCGAVKSEVLHGHWTDEQFKVPENRAQMKDSEFLKQMGVKP